MSCLLCKNENLKTVYNPPNAAGRALGRCSACGLMQMSPMPSLQELSAYYQKYDILGEREPYYEKLWLPEALATPEGRDILKRFNWAKGLCKKFGKTLDIGSGPGLFLKLVQDDGGEAIGCELNLRAAAKSAALYGVRVYPGTIDQVAAADFDVIALWDLLEHVDNPRHLIASCHARLKPGGWLFIETPNEAALLDRTILTLLKLGIIGPAATFYGLHHLALFQKTTVRRLLEESGFAMVEIKGAATDPTRVFRGNGFKDKITRLGLGILFLLARLVGRQNKMLIAAVKRT